MDKLVVLNWFDAYAPRVFSTPHVQLPPTYAMVMVLKLGAEAVPGLACHPQLFLRLRTAFLFPNGMYSSLAVALFE